MNLLDMIGQPALGGPRECGSGRTAGSIYLECGFSVHGKPLVDFLIDPVRFVDPHQLGLSAIGVTTITDVSGVTHLVDWVGESHYPYPLDFITEAARMGVSRKVATNTDFKRLTPGSMMIFLHAKGGIENNTDYTGITDFSCPCGKGHQAGDDCIGLQWHVTSGTTGTSGRRERHLVCGTYTLKSDPGIPPRYAPAYFMAVPITNISVIASHGGTVNQAALNAARASSLPVTVATS